MEQQRAEATRWLRQARADLGAAQDSLAAGRHEWAAFQAQQAAEKAVKAVWYAMGEDPWGHSVARLIEDLPPGPERAALQPHLDTAKALDKLYVPTRHPNGLPDLIPAEAFTAAEAREAIARALAVVDAAAEIRPAIDDGDGCRRDAMFAARTARRAAPTTTDQAGPGCRTGRGASRCLRAGLR